MKTAFVSLCDPKDVNGFGHYVHKMLSSLEAEFDAVEYMINRYPSGVLPIVAAKYVIYRKLLKKYYSIRRDTYFLKEIGRRVSRKLSKSDVDFVLSFVNPGSQPLAYVECNQPMVFWADAPFASAIDYYSAFTREHMCNETVRDAIANERSTLERCSLAVYWSDWGAQMAIQHYQVDPAKIRVVPAGANLDPQFTLAEVRTLIDARPTDRCKLLFLGVEWYRKRGDVALQVAKALNQSGLPTELTVVGCEPPGDEVLPSFVKPLGFISRFTPAGMAHLSQLLSESHFLIVPSQAESFGIVFCEASAFGVPSIATKTGGITTAVKDHVNGMTFALDAPIDAYCSYITNLFANYSQYKALALSSFHDYETRLNWSVATHTLKQMMMELL